MSINFCDRILKPKIRCRSVTVDGHNVTNILAPPAAFRNKGFLVESYIKPPVSFLVMFPVNIMIERVVLCTSVGSQRSCAVELYTHSQKRDHYHDYHSWLSGDCSSSSHERDGSEGDADRVFACIGRAHDEEAHNFSFVNRTFRASREFSLHKPMVQHLVAPGDGNMLKTSELSTRFHKNLTDVSHLRVRITRVARSSICAVRWMEVWGQPSRTCPKHLIQTIMNLCTVPEKPPTSALPSTSTKETVSDVPEVDNEQLPEEFIDPLTNEMMLMPVLLPCGKTVDQSSLDKHVAEQAHWGRVPSDPFTGKPFTEQHKPISNNPLKARMDRFLLHEPELAKQFDFRVGRRGSTLSTPSITQSTLLSDQQHGSKRSLDDGHEPHTKVPHLITHTASQKAQHVQSISPASISTDLDSALRHTLAGLPSFLNKPKPARDELYMCVFCQTSMDTGCMYKLECAHVVCRQCLQEHLAPRLQCTQCEVWTDRTKISKAHR